MSDPITVRVEAIDLSVAALAWLVIRLWFAVLLASVVVVAVVVGAVAVVVVTVFAVSFVVGVLVL